MQFSLVLKPWTLVHVREHVHACVLRIFVKLHVDSAVSYLSTDLIGQFTTGMVEFM